ncbi:MAG TPA: hypothetical protein VGK78_06800 [Nocardioides sp.]|uniref:hypothetical protein n=1 Tax=Nocardioides sp. TaxID=35761 RepID=UPI002F423186
MTTSTATAPTQAPTDTTWLRLVQASIAVGVVGLVVFGYVGMAFTTISEGDFEYTADYWYTGCGLPIALAGIGIALGVHRLQHGADGRLGRIGVWVNTVALTELFVQLGCSVVVGSELRWGPSYVVASLLTFVGTALLAAGSWRVGLLPRWMLGVWPLIWILGSFAGTGPVPFLLAGFLVLLGVILARRVDSRS